MNWSYCGEQQLRIDNCTALNLPPNIVFIELPDFSISLATTPPGDLVVTNPNFSVYGDGKLAAFVRAFSPKWYARISGCTNALNQYVNAWMDAGDVIPWHNNTTVYPYTNYDTDNIVSHVDPDQVTRLYRCIRGHGFSIDYPLGNNTVGQS